MAYIVPYDKKDDYSALIEQKMEEVKRLCDQHDIPFLAIFAVENSEQDTGYKVQGLLPGTKIVNENEKLNLKDDKISKLYLELMGYYKPEEISLDAFTDFPEEVDFPSEG